eukprot:860209-Amphidinium_carterae.2
MVCEAAPETTWTPASSARMSSDTLLPPMQQCTSAVPGHSSCLENMRKVDGSDHCKSLCASGRRPCKSENCLWATSNIGRSSLSMAPT